MSHENLKKYNGNKSDFYLSIFRVNNELLVRYFEEKGSGNGGFFRIIKIDLSNENKLLIDKENELKRLCNKLRVIDDKRNVRESRKLLFVYDERRLMPGEESGQLAMIGSKHLSRKQSILLESYHSKNKVLVFRPIENFDQVSDHNRIKFKNSQIVRERYELFEKEMEILPIVLDRHQPVDSLNKEIAYYMKSDRDGYGAGGGGGGGSVGAPNDTFNLKICLYVLKIEVDHKTKNNSIKHIVFLRKEECFQFDDDQTVEQSNEPEMKKRRKQSSKTSHIIRKMYMIQPRNHEFPSEIEIIFKNYNICYVNRTISKSKLEIAYSLSEYDINNNKVDVDELSSQKRTINNESEMSLQKRKQDRSSSSSSSSFNRRNSISTVNFENRTELETIPSEIEHKCETDDHEPKLLAIKPLRYDKNFIEQNRKNVSKIPVLRSGSSSLKYSNMRIKTPKRTPGTNNPMSMLLHAATLKNRDKYFVFLKQFVESMKQKDIPIR